MRMTTEEAFVKVLQRHGIAHAFGIIGSAFMPVSDLFDRAGIKFWDVAHEGNGGIMCDGYTRSTGAIAASRAGLFTGEQSRQTGSNRSAAPVKDSEGAAATSLFV